MKNFCFKTVAILGILFISLSIVSYFSYEPNALVKAQTLNIRSKPTVSSEDSAIVITLERGDYVHVIEVDDEAIDGYIWAKVKFTDADGKVKSGFCVYDFLIITEEPINIRDDQS